jgi:hypothetical protein
MRDTTRVLSLVAAAATGSVLLWAPPASAADTTTDLVSSLNPSTAGQAVTLTATVSGFAPDGQVTFEENGVTLDTKPAGSGVAELVITSWAAGSHVVTATYSDSSNTPSSDVLTQVVNAPVPPPPPPPPPPAPPAPPAAPAVKPPKVHLSVSTTKASVGDKIVLQWRTKRADTVRASGDWGGAQRAKGRKELRVTERGTHVFKLTVANAAGRKSAKVAVVASRKAKELELVVTEELVLVGTDVDVSADGLAKGEAYTIRLDGKPVLTGKADKRGDVERTFTLAKTAPEGALDLTITGSNPGRVGAAVLNVIKPKTLDVQVDRDKVKKKKEQTVTVTGLAAGEAVKLIYAGKQLTAGTADESGEFTYTFNVGTDIGDRTVKVFGAVRSRVGEATFTVTGTTEGTGPGTARLG